MKQAYLPSCPRDLIPWSFHGHSVLVQVDSSVFQSQSVFRIKTPGGGPSVFFRCASGDIRDTWLSCFWQAYLTIPRLLTRRRVTISEIRLAPTKRLSCELHDDTDTLFRTTVKQVIPSLRVFTMSVRRWV